MKSLQGPFTALMAVVFIFMGCSNGVFPIESNLESSVESRVSVASNPHSLLGLWTFVCDPDTGTVDVTPLRDADLHLNALKFLEPPPSVYLTIESTPVIQGNILDVNIGLRNPFVGLKVYTGFDVCGIIFTHGTETGYADPEIVLAGEGDTRLLNADGYTRWWNPAEFPHNGTVFHYKDGIFGMPADEADFNCTLNGYKYFADELDADDPLTVLDPINRGTFGAGVKNIRHYTIDLSGGLIFNYAVDACWKMPQGGPPYDVPDDFPSGANRQEAYRIEITELGNDLYHVDGTYLSGGDMHIYVDVWDHFNSDQNVVYGESLAGLPLEMAITPIESGEGWSRYQLSFSGKKLHQNGEGELLIAVQSEAVGYGDLLPGKPVTAYFKHTFSISPDAPPRWTIHWPQNHSVDGPDVAVDDSGNIYAGGWFFETVDFDPGPGVVIHTVGYWKNRAFLSKFNHSGVFQWVRVWGEVDQRAEAYGIAVDDMGNILATGWFSGTVDFDPGLGVEEHTSIGESGTFLSKFDSDGNFIWVRTWGSTAGISTAVDSFGNPCVTGFFKGTVDFDPGPGIEEYTPIGQQDIFLTKFDSNGNFQWARTWGGFSYPNYDSGNSVATDGLGSIFVTGIYRGNNVDFDPGPGIDLHSSGDTHDVFLSKFDAGGTFQWAGTWDADHGNEVATDSSNNVFAVGHFHHMVDFDPGPGIDEHNGEIHGKTFLSKFDTDGVFKWARAWGQGGQDYNTDVVVGPSQSIYVAGNFWGTVDLDPGPGVDEHSSHISNAYDASLSKFDPAGDYLWGFNWGHARSWAVSVDIYENIFVGGSFGGTVDFDPGPEVDEQSSFDSYDIYLSKFPPDGNW